MQIKKGFVLREVGGETIVVPVGKMSKEFHGMINLNATGAFLWRFYTDEHSVDDGVAALCAEYDVTDEKARADVEKFTEILLRNGFAE